MQDHELTPLTASAIDYALDGARRAIARLGGTSDPRVIAHAAAEAAFWIAAVDEGLGGKAERGAYVEARRQGAVDDLMTGIRFVRNASVHSELARIAISAGGLTIPFTVPFSIPVIPRWIDEAPPSGYESQRRSYMRELAGKDVVPTLERAADWLAQYQSGDG
ncbi:hypothetical protein [Demequina lutea]|uniref:Uncharacterized protein n=1 Tax=Demequina lutea TaxID=431489 RepID=A0A7Z0CIX6_9MICO|nr:hypothetical protein [Demequina lutea]NYI40348.1 hypothetical protein [Demequina lutea]